MKKEAHIMPEQTPIVLQGLECPKKCGGYLQVMPHEEEPLSIACDKCGITVDVARVFVSYDWWFRNQD